LNTQGTGVFCRCFDRTARRRLTMNPHRNERFRYISILTPADALVNGETPSAPSHLRASGPTTRKERQPKRRFRQPRRRLPRQSPHLGQLAPARRQSDEKPRRLARSLRQSRLPCESAPKRKTAAGVAAPPARAWAESPSRARPSRRQSTSSI